MPNVDISTYLADPSLYHRNIQDFKYTIKLFEILNDEDRLKSYIKNTDIVNFSDLYDKSGKIKPAGDKNTADDFETLVGVIESWSNEGGDAGEQDFKDFAGKRLTRHQMEQADKHSVLTFSDVDKSKLQPGDVIRVSSPKAKDSSAYEVTDNWDPGYYVYNNDKFIRLADADV